MIGIILAFVIIIASLYWLLRETNNLTINLAHDLKQLSEHKEQVPMLEPGVDKTELHPHGTIESLWFDFETFCGTTTYIDNCSASENKTVFYSIDKERATQLNIDLTKYNK